MQEKVNVGGGVRCSIALRVWGEIDPTVLSQAVGITPTYVHRAGDAIGDRPSLRHKHNMWMVETVEASNSVDNQLQALVAQLPSASAWLNAVGNARSDIYCAVAVTDSLSGWQISVDTMRSLARYELEVGFSVTFDDESPPPAARSAHRSE